MPIRLAIAALVGGLVLLVTPLVAAGWTLLGIGCYLAVVDLAVGPPRRGGRAMRRVRRRPGA